MHHAVKIGEDINDVNKNSYIFIYIKLMIFIDADYVNISVCYNHIVDDILYINIIFHESLCIL